MPTPTTSFVRTLLGISTMCVLHVHAASPEPFPLPRDASVRDIVAAYSVEKTCHPAFLEKFHLSKQACSAKLELARQDCPALIAAGLPDWLDERQTYMLMGRSRVCLLTTIWGRPYNSDAADRASEEIWKKRGERG